MRRQLCRTRRVLTEATSDGITATDAYDRAGRLLEVANVTATGTLSRFTYGLDAAGNRTVMTTTRGSQYYTYDLVNRLTGVCYAASCAAGQTAQACLGCVGSPISTPAATVVPNPSDTFTNWTYDAVGNRLTEVNYLGTAAYVYDAADRLTTRTPPGASAITYSYDNNGNQTGAGTNAFVFDLADRLSSATVGATTETYTWAGDGVRLSAVRGAGAANTTKFVVDRNFGLPQLAFERDGSGATRRSYTYGNDLIAQLSPSSGLAFYHHDGLGSISDLTSTAGGSLSWSENQPWGAVRTAGASGAPVNPFGFAGQYQDAATGLYFMRARMYDPVIARFLAMDPVSSDPSSPRSNAFAYVDADPISHVDPSGTICVEAMALAVAGPGGALAGGGITVGCAIVIFVVAGVAAWAAGSAVGHAATEIRGDPTHQRWTPPSQDPGLDQAIRDLQETLTPDIHFGLPGGGRLPELCEAHREVCKALLIAATAAVGGLLAKYGGPEGLEEHLFGPHKPSEKERTDR